MKESSIEEKVSAWATANQVLHLKINVRGRKGWPDHLYACWGGMCLIEYKVPGESLAPIQEYVIGELAKQGIIVEVFDSSADAINHLEKWKNEQKATFLARRISCHGRV